MTHRRYAQQRGQVTLLLIVLMTALTAAFGLVYDGGEIRAAQDRASAIAEEAARAGARDIDLGAFHRSGAIVPDPIAALADAEAYMSGVKVSGHARLDGDSVVVTVSLQQPMTILGLGGRWSVTVGGEGRAHLAHGTGGGQP
jgi:Flp pilus assembly protein TadG